MAVGPIRYIVLDRILIDCDLYTGVQANSELAARVHSYRLAGLRNGSGQLNPFKE